MAVEFSSLKAGKVEWVMSWEQLEHWMLGAKVVTEKGPAAVIDWSEGKFPKTRSLPQLVQERIGENCPRVVRDDNEPPKFS